MMASRKKATFDDLAPLEKPLFLAILRGGKKV